MAPPSWTHPWGGGLSWARWALSAPWTAPHCWVRQPPFPPVGGAPPSGLERGRVMLALEGTLAPGVQLFLDNVAFSRGHTKSKRK